jgi:CRISPR-associated protein Csd1
LLAPSSWKPSDKAGKNIPIFKNRKNISDDTAVVFWLRDALEISDLELLDKPDEGKIRAMIDSVYSGQATPVKQIKPDEFYAITLSGAAARIAVRDWVETSLPSLRANLAGWFQNIEIDKYDQGRGSLVRQFPALTSLAWSTKSKSANDVQHGRIGAALWKCAVLRASPPIWVIAAVLNRIRAEQGNTTSERIALLKLYLNRRSDYQGGGYYMTTLDESNKNNAYICGRIFAVLESIQYHASGGNLNAGIRERFFSFASNMPSTAFGRLMKLSQHHLSKIRGDKPGLAVNLDRKLQELMTNIKGSSFPPVFSLEEQASFAIGYYHQRQRDFDAKSNSKEE